MSVSEDFRFDLCGGHHAIDFSNTLSFRHTDAPVERLTTFDRMLTFAIQSGILTRAQAERAHDWAERHPKEADKIRKDAIVLREALYKVFAAVAKGEPPPEQQLAVINAWLPRLSIGPDLEWTWRDGPDAPDAFMAPIVRAGFELLTSLLRERVRMCEADDCVWLFLDTSKNRSRRWCDMKQCGNRMKARRFHQRHQA